MFVEIVKITFEKVKNDVPQGQYRVSERRHKKFVKKLINQYKKMLSRKNHNCSITNAVWSRKKRHEVMERSRRRQMKKMRDSCIIKQSIKKCNNNIWQEKREENICIVVENIISKNCNSTLIKI